MIWYETKDCLIRRLLRVRRKYRYFSDVSFDEYFWAGGVPTSAHVLALTCVNNPPDKYILTYN